MPEKISLDFDDIKSSIKTYLQGQDELTDYEFEGSAMNILLDAMAYVTHYNALTANMAMSESFLSTAQQRKNIISRSQGLGYVPSTITAATVEVDMSVTSQGSQTSVTVPKGTKFTSLLDNETFTFITMDEFFLTGDAGGTLTGTATLFQGVTGYQTWTHTASSSDIFKINQGDVDSKHLTINVTDEFGITEWTSQTNIILTDKDSQVFYRQEGDDGNVEVYFGDDVISAAIANDDVVRIDYLVTRGPAANGCSGFDLTNGITHLSETYLRSSFTITNTNSAGGGGHREDDDRIKMLAPKVYKSQQRAVTVEDYTALLLNKYSFIDAINVWGGEDNTPPQYGKVFISIKPNYGTELTLTTKSQIIEEILSTNSIIGIIPEIVTPEYVYINTTTEVEYDKYDTTRTEGELITAIDAGISSFFQDIDSVFELAFYFSKYVAYIDDVDVAIKNNVTSITLSKKFTTYDGDSIARVFDFSVPINSTCFRSSTWEDGSGDVWQLKSCDEGIWIHLYKNDVNISGEKGVGNIDPDNGIIYLNSFVASTSGNQEIELFVSPVSNNVYLTGNNMVLEGTKTITAVELNVKLYLESQS